MAYPYTMHKTVVTGETITASDINQFNSTHITNNIPSTIDDLSANVSAMQTTSDPYPASSESLATTLAAEIQQLRYQVATQLGLTYWYQDVTTPYGTFQTNMAAYKRPGLTWISVTQFDVEANTGTANQTKILFPDGTSRSVTEDTSSTNKYRRCDITAAAEFTSGTEDSGVRSGITEATNTWYAVYAVKSTINSANFVLAMDTTYPTAANFSALNTRYGTNGWVYLGYVPNGNNSDATGDLIKFTQSGNLTIFRQKATGNSNPLCGLRLASTAGATSITYTYANGSNIGSAQVPNTIHNGIISVGTEAGGRMTATEAGGTTRTYFQDATAGLSAHSMSISLDDGMLLTDFNGNSKAMDIVLTGFIDSALGVGPNPVI